MKVTLMWDGGANYGPSMPGQDEEHFDTLRDALDAVAARAHDSYYPCAYEERHEGERGGGWIYVGHLDDTGDQYPDYVVSIGPRGGVQVSRA